MAGIGFELRKLYDERGIFSKIEVYGYTGAISAGPMLLGMMLLIGVIWIGGRAGLSEEDQETVVCVITYCLLAAMFFSSFYSYAGSRFIADMIYENHAGMILSSMTGILCILLPTGGVCAAVFLLFSGLSWGQAVPAFLLFELLLSVWTEMNYLSAIKDYKGIFIGYVLAVGAAFLSAFLFCEISGASTEGMLYSCCIGYGTMMIADLVNLCRFFEDERKEPFLFLKWFDRYPELAGIGLLMNTGLFSHLIITWHSGIGEQIRKLFYAAPQYDIPALFAFLTTLVTTVTFVVSTEVHFYPVYRDYYDLFNGNGSIDEITRAGARMRSVLDRELSFIAKLQFFVTFMMVSMGPVVLGILPLGFNDFMDGYFRMLCVGYGAYAVGNVMMLLLLYFADDAGALRAAAVFAAGTTAGTILFLLLPADYYGTGFALGSLAFMFYCWKRLNRFTKHLGYYVLSTQPIVPEEKRGFFSKISGKLDDAVEKADTFTGWPEQKRMKAGKKGAAKKRIRLPADRSRER